MDFEHDCRDALAAPSSPASRLHIASCDRCADELTRAFLESIPSVPVPPQFAVAVRDKAAMSPRPRDPAYRGLAAALALSAAVVAVAIAASDGLIARYGFGFVGAAAAALAMEATALIWWLGRTAKI
jgi:hypothetical protein